MDAVDPALVDRVESPLARVSGVQRVDSVRLRWIGHELRAEVDVTVDAASSAVEADDVAEAGHHALLHDVSRLTSAIVHANPSDADGRAHHAALAHHGHTPAPARGRRQR